MPWSFVQALSKSSLIIKHLNMGKFDHNICSCKLSNLKSKFNHCLCSWTGTHGTRCTLNDKKCYKFHMFKLQHLKNKNIKNNV